MSVEITEDPTEELFGSAERVKLLLDEDGITTNEDKINEYILEATNIVNGELKYLFADADFPLTRQTLGNVDFENLVGQINQITRGKFWIENNDSDTVFNTALETLQRFRQLLSEQPPAETQ